MWIWASAAAGTIVGLWVLWEIIRSAVRRGILEARAHEGPPENRSFGVLFWLVLLAAAALAIAVFLS